MDVIPIYTEVNTTGCCPVPDVGAWDRTVVHFADKPFIRRYSRSLFYVPVTLSSALAAAHREAEAAGATMPPTQAMILSRDISPFRAEQLYAVTHPVPGSDNVTLDGDFASRVFDGPYRDAGRWNAAIRDYATSSGRTPAEVYFFYTTCPRCAKAYGHNYVVALARLVDAG